MDLKISRPNISGKLEVPVSLTQWEISIKSYNLYDLCTGFMPYSFSNYFKPLFRALN